MNDYYVYAHIRNDNDTYFYIGKGRNDRAYYKPRNEKHDKIMNEVGMHVAILYKGLTEEEAYQKEYDVVMDCITNQNYNIDIDGYRDRYKTDRFLTNQTFGSRGSIGESNPQYNVTPKERMSEETYNKWRESTVKRLEAQVGDKNPNWHNNTLKKKLEENPELKIEYYSRKGTQNGRATPIELYDIDGNFINIFHKKI